MVLHLNSDWNNWFMSQPILLERSSCIDLIFASQPNLVVDSGVQSSLHQNCHHQIMLARFNLKVVFPPPYEREAWHLKKKQIFTILEKQSMVSIWKNHFKIWMSMTWFIYLIELSKIYYVISLCMKQTDVMTDPPWTNSSIRYLIQDKNEAHKRF